MLLLILLTANREEHYEITNEATFAEARICKSNIFPF